MAEITVEQLKKQIEAKRFEPLYLFFGEELYLMNIYTKRLSEAVTDKAAAAFNLRRFEADEADMDDVLDSLSMYPFMAEKSCTVLTSFSLDAVSASDKKKLMQYFENPNPSAVFIVCCAPFDAGKKPAKWNEFAKAFGKCGAVVSFEHKTQAETEKLLCAYASKLGSELSRKEAGYLISVTKNDLQTLFNELDKLCAFCGAGEITKEMIDKIVSFNAETTVFVLSRALIGGDLDKAYFLLDILCKQNEKPISILGALSSAYIDLYRVKAAIINGYQSGFPGEFFSYKGREFVLDNAAKSVRSISIDSLRKSLKLLCDTDILLKSTPQENHRTILEGVFAKLYQLRTEG